jgi:hypothetical protein
MVIRMANAHDRSLARIESAAMKPLERIRRLAQRPSRLIDYFREPRDIVIGGPIVNRLGLQVARTSLDHLLWLARRSEVSSDIRDAYETISRDGIVVIPDFLPSHDFDALLSEHERSRKEDSERYQHVRFGDNLISDQLTITDYSSHYPEHIRSLRDNPFLLALASAVSRRTMSFKPHLRAEVIFKPEPDLPHRDHNEAQFLHTDRHYTFVKAFFYLNDVDESNAPYTFVKGSHRVNISRLRYEYELSLRIAGNRREFDRRDRVETQAELHQKIYDSIAARLMKENGLVESSIVGRPNTLIMSNNQGLHRRGDYHGPRPRSMVNLDYKYLESPAHRLYPVLRHLPPRLTGE